MGACPRRAPAKPAPLPPPNVAVLAQEAVPIEAEERVSSPSWSEIEGSETSDGDLMAVLQAVEDADAEHESSRVGASASLTPTSRTPPSLT